MGPDASVRVYPPEILDGDLDAQWVAELADAQQVVFAPAVSGAAIDVAGAYRLFHAVKRLTAALVSGGGPARLFIVTRNAQPVVDGDRANPVHAVLWGLGRSIALEHPEIWGGLIDLDESVPAVLAARWVLAEAGATTARTKWCIAVGCAMFRGCSATSRNRVLPVWYSTPTAANWSSAPAARSVRT